MLFRDESQAWRYTLEVPSCSEAETRCLGMQGHFQLHAEFEDSLGSRRSCVKQIKRNSQTLKAILCFKMTHFNYVSLRGVMFFGVGSRRFELIQNQLIWET